MSHRHSKPVLGVPVMTGTLRVIRSSCGGRTSSLQSRKSPYFCLAALLWLHVCVNSYGGRDPVCVCQSRMGFWEGGWLQYCSYQQVNRPTHHLPNGQTQVRGITNSSGTFFSQTLPSLYPTGRLFFFHWSMFFPHSGFLFRDILRFGL